LLYAELVAQLIAVEYACRVGRVALRNEASVALHEKMGFIKVAHFKGVGYELNRWVDVGYWQLLV
jgi:L-amino acid N-acyltransferase YncA